MDSSHLPSTSHAKGLQHYPLGLPLEAGAPPDLSWRAAANPLSWSCSLPSTVVPLPPPNRDPWAEASQAGWEAVARAAQGPWLDKQLKIAEGDNPWLGLS